jgi:hypothetical protein
MRTVILAAALILACAVAAAAAPIRAEDDAQMHAPILAKPRDVTLLKDLSGETPGGGIYFGGRYKVTLKKIRVVWGSNHDSGYSNS